MGGKIPRKVKEQIIKQWLYGLTRQQIAKQLSIGTGSVTGIIQEVRQAEDGFNDIELLREVAVSLRRDGLDVSQVAFARRLRPWMAENRQIYYNRSGYNVWLDSYYHICEFSIIIRLENSVVI
jgi:hypothetical protein